MRTVLNQVEVANADQYIQYFNEESAADGAFFCNPINVMIRIGTMNFCRRAQLQVITFPFRERMKKISIIF